MKKLFGRLRRPAALLLAAALFIASLAALSACGASGKDKVYIYNLGEYLADGSEGIFDCISGFE